MDENKNHGRKRKNIRTISIIGITVCLIGVGAFVYIKKQFSQCSQFIREHTEYESLPRFDAKGLSVYDGIKNEKTYIGFHCIVYDVTEGKDQYYAQGKGYHYLVGRDATKQLEIFGGDIIESKYPKVGILTQ